MSSRWPRRCARELITEAVEVTGRVSGNANHRFTAFNATVVALYQVSIAKVLGDTEEPERAYRRRAGSRGACQLPSASADTRAYQARERTEV